MRKPKSRELHADYKRDHSFEIKHFFFDLVNIIKIIIKYFIIIICYRVTVASDKQDEAPSET